MRPVAAIAYSFFNLFQLPTMAEFVRTVNEQGGQSKKGREYNYFNTVRGLAQWVISPVTREEINRTVKNSVTYRKDDRRDPFAGRRGTGGFHRQVQRIKTLISRSPLSNQELKIFDAACNHGHIAEYLDQRIKRYTGMDVFNEVIQSAWKEAEERFPKISCSDYSFVRGNILLRSSYKGLPQDNNLVICTGTIGHFSPYQIAQLLDNLASVLDNSGDSRIIIGFPIIPNNYDSSRLKSFCSKYKEEDGVRYIVQRDGLEFRRYEKDDIVRLVQQNKKLEIIDIIEPSEELRNAYLCLKRKSTNPV